MKIVLLAFGNKLSGVMEVPEETMAKFKLAMSQPIQVFSNGFRDEDKWDLMKSPINTICTFEWTGGVFHQKDHDFDGAREYQLVEIEKK